jgi:hypothetical protein
MSLKYGGNAEPSASGDVMDALELIGLDSNVPTIGAFPGLLTPN